MIPETGDIEIHELNNETLLETCRAWQNDECICCVEDVSSSPQMGVKSAFSFGEGFGCIKMALMAHSMSFALVRPQKWKAEFGCNLGNKYTTKEKKEKDIETCRQLYPTVSLKRTEKCKVDSDGYADALLLATYARRKL